MNRKHIITAALVSVLAFGGPATMLADNASTTDAAMPMLQMQGGGLQMPADWYNYVTPSNNGFTNGSSFVNNDGLLSFRQYPDGPRLIQLEGDQTVYWVSEHNYKLPMLNETVFKSYHNKHEEVQAVSQDEFDFYLTAQYIRLQGNSKIYQVDIEKGVKQQLLQSALDEAPIDDEQIITVNKTEFNSYKTGSAIASLDQ